MKCPKCANVNSSIQYKLTDYNIIRCGQCGLFFNDRFPPKESKENTFSDGYYCGVQVDIDFVN